MKAKVIRAFTCVNSRVYYAIGSTYQADESRINYLVNKGYVVAEKPAHIPKAETPAPSKDETPKPIKRKRNEHK